ncbi:MAG: putative toxin-antitoxin system toxin component, PIN family [Candidatus Udaeobacter sp.]
MRVVFDTNVLYSALAAKGFCEEVVDEAVAECDIVWSNALKQELESLITRRHKIGPATRVALEAYADLCEFVEPEPLDKRVCRDKDDDVVLATALAGNADVIVTGDEDLLVLKKFRGIEILSPRQFLERLDRTG